MRVACFAPYPAAGPSVRHRIMLLQQGLGTDGFELTLFSFTTRRLFNIRREFGLLRTAEKLFWLVACTLRLIWRVMGAWRFQTVIIHREAFPLGPAWFERAIIWINPRTVYDFDDAIWEPPSNAVNQRALLFSPSRVADILRHCKAAAAGSEALARYARQFNGTVLVVPTTYAGLPRTAPRDAPVPLIYWIGNWGNAHYVQSLAAAMTATHNSGIRFRLRLVGGPDLEALQFPSDIEVERLPWCEELEAQWLREADIGIMPLPDSPYERGKCAFKLVQYMSAGLPVIASPVGANCEVVISGETGLLASTDDEWMHAFHLLLSDVGLRQSMGAAGHQRYLDHYSPAIVLRRWRQLLSVVQA